MSDYSKRPTDAQEEGQLDDLVVLAGVLEDVPEYLENVLEGLVVLVGALEVAVVLEGVLVDPGDDLVEVLGYDQAFLVDDRVGPEGVLAVLVILEGALVEVLEGVLACLEGAPEVLASLGDALEVLASLVDALEDPACLEGVREDLAFLEGVLADPACLEDVPVDLASLEGALVVLAFPEGALVVLAFLEGVLGALACLDDALEAVQVPYVLGSSAGVPVPCCGDPGVPCRVPCQVVREVGCLEEDEAGLEAAASCARFFPQPASVGVGAG